MSHQQTIEPAQEPLISAKDVVASGLAGVTVAALSSRLGIEGTLLGAGVASMVGTASTSVYKAYLNEATTDVSRWPWALRVLAAFGWFAFRHPRERRLILRTALLAGLVACLLGVAAVTSLEVSTQKSFSCLIWKKCPVGVSETRPSIMGGSPIDGGGEGETDSDGDGLPDSEDNCPDTPNQDQAKFGDLCDDNGDGGGGIDSDGDGLPDDQDTDDDNDGVLDATPDNCQFTRNPDQSDVDGDNVGDACDTVDTDSDGVPDDQDTDDDNDGMTDNQDACPTDPNCI